MEIKDIKELLMGLSKKEKRVLVKQVISNKTFYNIMHDKTNPSRTTINRIYNYCHYWKDYIK